MKLKPEYRKLLEIYPNLEDELKEKPAEFWGFVEPLNAVTSCYDKVWIAPSMLYGYRKYKAVDPLVKILCQNPDFNKTFQEECEEQWDNAQDYIAVKYCIGEYNSDSGWRNCIRVYKEDVKQEFV